MISRILIIPLAAFLSLEIASCGGSGLISPDTHGGTRILGVDFGTKVPSLIAFSRLYEINVGPPRDLFVMFPDGSHERRLTDTPADSDFPAFSPDGLSLAYVSNSSTTGWGNHDVFRMASPKKTIQLTSDGWEFDAASVDWGPDSIVTARHNTLIMAPFDVIGLWKMDPDGKNQEAVSTEFTACYDPCISRDGSMIAFCARLNCPSQDDPGCSGTLQLFILHTDETEPVQLTHFGGTPADPILTRHPALDFDGKRIVFQTTFWGDDWEIAYIYIDDPDELIYRVTESPADDVEPCFDQSGQWIAFASNRDGNFELYKTWDIQGNPDTDPPPETFVRLTDTPQDEGNPDWSPVYP
jgi:Tol biopolymer transport system component